MSEENRNDEPDNVDDSNSGIVKNTRVIEGNSGKDINEKRKKKTIHTDTVNTTKQRIVG